MSLELFNKGRDHKVYRSTTSPEWVFKKPYGIVNFGLLFSRKDRVVDLRKDVEAAQRATEITGVQVPETTVYRYNKGYVVAQRYIKEDKSVDIERFLEANKLEIIKHYDEKPTNFISNEGQVYIVDPFKGILSRVALTSHVMSVDKLRKLLLKYRKVKKYLNF